MENIVFTQLSVDEVRRMLREEVRNVITECLPAQLTVAKDEFLNIQQVAEYINLAIPSVYGLVHRRQIPFIKRGKKLLFETEKINEWLHEGSHKTKSQIIKDTDDYLNRRNAGKHV